MDNLDDAFDDLYAASPEDFVAERSRLAKALKDRGQAEDAKTLAATRKPTVAAWVLNQLARLNRREIDLLLDAGHRLREAQAGLLAGPNKRRSTARARLNAAHSCSSHGRPSSSSALAAKSLRPSSARSTSRCGRRRFTGRPRTARSGPLRRAAERRRIRPPQRARSLSPSARPAATQAVTEAGGAPGASPSPSGCEIRIRRRGTLGGRSRGGLRSSRRRRGAGTAESRRGERRGRGSSETVCARPRNATRGVNQDHSIASAAGIESNPERPHPPSGIRCSVLGQDVWGIAR